jgi:hypothetical protein
MTSFNEQVASKDKVLSNYSNKKNQYLQWTEARSKVFAEAVYIYSNKSPATKQVYRAEEEVLCISQIG